VHDVKIASANFINRKAWVAGRFGWQEGLEHSHMAIPNSPELFDTSAIKSSTTPK